MRETELKYEAEAAVRLPPLDGLPQVASVSGPETETLLAEYYDTDDLRLLRAGTTLRRREGGADEGWHLKLPEEAAGPTRRAARAAGPTSRRELRLPLNEPVSPQAAPVPDELARLVLVHTRGAALRPVARIETRRSRTTLRDASGSPLAETAADEVAAQTLGESTTLSRWNEVEVELTGGDPRLLKAADERLRRSGLRPAGRSTKLERALAAELQPAPAGHRLTRRSPSGEVVLAYLDQHAARFKALDPAVRRDEPDAVHQMRVAARRLRSALQAFPVVVPEPATRHLRQELKWIGGLLGDARDGEVLSDYLQTGLAGLPTELVLGPAKATVTAHFARREASARTAVREALGSPRYFGMLDELDRLISDPPLTPESARPAKEILPRAVAKAGRRTSRRMRRARRSPAGTSRDVALHETRKAAKRARYAAEAAAPACGKKARRFARHMKRVQSVLGDHNDAVNARATAREIGVHAHLAGENAFSFGLLHEWAHRDAVKRQDQAKRTWKRVTHSTSRRWLA
ncbi:MAG: CHAD domain-containing protein [Trebonia sp.]